MFLKKTFNVFLFFAFITCKIKFQFSILAIKSVNAIARGNRPAWSGIESEKVFETSVHSYLSILH